MKTFIQMTYAHGDTRQTFETDAAAKESFNQRIAEGNVAANLLKGGEQQKIRKYEEAGDEVVFHRHLQGG